MYLSKSTADAPRVCVMITFERAIPLTFLHANRPHIDSFALDVFDNGGRRIKPHRLGVEESRCEARRVVCAQVGGRIGDECEGRRVTLWEPVLAKASDLRENSLGELRRDSPLDHASRETVAVGLNATRGAPSGHITP